MSVIDLRSTYPGGQKVHDDPAVHVLDGIVTPAEAEHLRVSAEPHLSESRVSGDTTGVRSTGRTNSVCWLRHDLDDVTAGLADRLADLVGLPLANAESFQIIRYEVGQEYRPHFDAYDLTTERGQRCCERGGQRMVTLLGYLSEVEAGGETVFPRLGIGVAPHPGRVLIFHNCSPGSNVRHPDSLHGGAPVQAGRKWAFNLWFRESAR